jgi:predicted component of type VI protein secretion system
MKKIILFLSVILLGTGCGNKQKQIQVMSGKLLDNLTTACQLTPDQKSRVAPVVQIFVSSRVENKIKYGKDSVALKQANDSMKKNYINSLKGILNPMQMEQLKVYYGQLLAKPQQTGNGQ